MMTVHAEAERNTKNAMVKTVKYLLLITACIFTYLTYGQVSIENNQKIEQQLIIKNANIDTTKIQGYRIQLAFNTDRSLVENIKAKYINYFPEGRLSYILYQQPYWKLRVGNFYREIDAITLLKEVRVFFPNAFVVPDNIDRPIITENNKD
jgi:hypothetical protein